MTNEKAIQNIEDVFDGKHILSGEAMSIAIKAIKKQIPMKPNYSYSFKCQNCGKELFSYNIPRQKYCSECGQALDCTEATK